MIDFSKLRSQIIDTLGGRIGIYSLPNGAKVPAIAVDNGIFPPPGTQVEGLEVAIAPDTEISLKPLANARQWDYEFEITLRFHSGDPQDFDEALEKIVGILGNQVTLGARLQPLNGLDIVPSQAIRVTQTFLKRTP